MKPISSYRIEPKLKEKMRQAVKNGIAKDMTDLIQKAVIDFLSRNEGKTEARGNI